MKKKLAVMLAALLCLSGVAVPTANALRFFISLGDDAYYVHGPGYWVGPVYYIWVPGHWERHHGEKFWVHGYYVARR